MTTKFTVVMERSHLEDKISCTTFFDRLETAKKRAVEWSKKYNEWARIEVTEDYEFEDNTFRHLAVYINGTEYSTKNPRIADLIEKDLTYKQARRYLMSEEGISLQRIADIENRAFKDNGREKEIKKSAVQQSILQARTNIAASAPQIRWTDTQIENMDSAISFWEGGWRPGDREEFIEFLLKGMRADEGMMIDGENEYGFYLIENDDGTTEEDTGMLMSDVEEYVDTVIGIWKELTRTLQP